eukprot:NODE_4536_length_795_cov_3.319035_g4196_i0.p1 GENE.NODE_4536_length_795_cov_3.319035_g4196_i0~~NODE_4536_length_795_cov_3.319035_g4196_i0.p1  ORF type:complete len:226 (+),score=35.65 NODE_4536_length_795_cov_3.319035_g4196_i0:89-679(+)
MQPFLQWYAHHTHHSPILTKSATACVLFSFGDLIAQLSSDRPLDVSRLFRMALWAGAFAGPAGHFWYNALEAAGARLVLRSPGGLLARSPAAMTGFKVFSDQFVYTPPCSCLFFFTMAAMQGFSVVESIAEVQLKLWPTLKINWVVWSLVHCITFNVVPLPYRVAFVNVVSVFWACFISMVAASAATITVSATHEM